MIAALAAAWLIFYAATSRAAQRPARILGAALGLQLVAGILNLVLLAPIWMQQIHLLIADLLWISLVLLCATRVSKA
jgi:heme A synthase